MVDEPAGSRTRAWARGMVVFPESQFCPPSVLLKIAVAVGVPPPVGLRWTAAYIVLGFVGSIAKAWTPWLNPVAVQVAPLSVLMEKPVPPCMAYKVDGVVGAIARRVTGSELTTFQLCPPSVLL
jgi:hypothetical protein